VFQAGASHFGVADATALATHTHDFESRYLDSLIAPLPSGQARYDELSPLNHTDGLSCPVLLLQGLEDPIVPPAQAEAFVEALKRAHLPYAYLAFEGEQHGWRRAETIIAALEAELSFYGQVFGFNPPGIPQLQLERPE
jgi:dipeptidyl aminopeptidase/acylaminoacyl peptidase